MRFGKRARSLVLWSIISAAFIGPGTVTTAASSGASFGYALLWALLFSTIACVVLQEAAVRLTIGSGDSLGAAIARRYGSWGRWLVVGAILVGGIAYQAGNILGAVSGLALVVDVDVRIPTVVTASVGALILWFGRENFVARLLGTLVALMGVAFLAVAFGGGFDWRGAVMGLVRPSMPDGAVWLVLGLVGTTIVPYNLFLASGLRHNQTVSEMRFGLVGAIAFGGLISMAIILVGAMTDGPFSFDALADAMSDRLGPWARGLFAWGLFAAGLTSSVTAPLAAAITARSLFDDGSGNWSSQSTRYRSVWIAVVVAGLIFGVSGVRPIPVIIAAQAINGALLPLVAVLLLLLVSDRLVMGNELANRWRSNVVMLVVVLVTLVLGSTAVVKAAYTAAGSTLADTAVLRGALVFAVAVTGVLALQVMRRAGEHGHREE